MDALTRRKDGVCYRPDDVTGGLGGDRQCMDEVCTCMLAILYLGSHLHAFVLPVTLPTCMERKKNYMKVCAFLTNVKDVTVVFTSGWWRGEEGVGHQMSHCTNVCWSQRPPVACAASHAVATAGNI